MSSVNVREQTLHPRDLITHAGLCGDTAVAVLVQPFLAAVPEEESRFPVYEVAGSSGRGRREGELTRTLHSLQAGVSFPWCAAVPVRKALAVPPRGRRRTFGSWRWPNTLTSNDSRTRCRGMSMTDPHSITPALSGRQVRLLFVRDRSIVVLIAVPQLLSEEVHARHPGKTGGGPEEPEQQETVVGAAGGWDVQEVHAFGEGELPRRLWRVTQSLSR